MIFIIILIFIIIFIIPFPVKIRIKLNKKGFLVYIFNKKLSIKKKTNKKAKPKKENKDFKRNFNPSNLKKLIKTLEDSRLKPSLKLNMQLVYGLDDAAQTAMLYGIISTILPLLIRYLSKFIKIDCNKIDISPIFNETTLELVIESIIFVSFAKIIYMMVLVYNSLKKQNNF